MYNRVIICCWVLCASAVLTLGCGEEDTDTDEETAAHWTYEGESGPEYWGDLDEEWATCLEGLEQSPVDLDSALAAEELDEILTSYSASGVHIINNGHSIQYNYDEGSEVLIGDHAYGLLQFHFHASSEHEVDGMPYEMEMHLVHSDDAGNLAVLGVFITEGEENADLSAAGWDMLPAAEGDTFEDDEGSIDATVLIPGGLTWRYTGSLTTPPCTEGVNWTVFQTPITLSASQIAAFTDLYDANHRPVQDLNGRDVSVGE